VVASAGASGPRQFQGRGILILVVPFVVYLVGMAVGGSLGDLLGGDPGAQTWYPRSYSVVIALTALLMLVLRRGYFHAPFRISWLSVPVGVLGVFVWVGLWWIDREFLGLGSLFGATREGFNPFVELRRDPTWMRQFLAIRFVGLVAVVPIIEEFFLRGFLMRYIDSPDDWDRVALGQATRLSVIGVVVYALLSHPAEPLAAVAWFGMVTWLYARTGSIWDCVLAHATTNLLLGLYVVSTGTWELW
jgi:CAAX prenyl protease-like protein